MKKANAVTKKVQKVDHAHKHDHCKHERLKFCAQCNKPHCLDCGTEWSALLWTSCPTYTLAGDANTLTGTHSYQNQMNYGQAIGNSGSGASATGTSAVRALDAAIAKGHTH